LLFAELPRKLPEYLAVAFLQNANHWRKSMTTSTSSNDNAAYVFDTAWQTERDRVTAIENIWDEHSQRSLAATGVRAGWHCLEVGAGGGSLAAWMASVAGPNGRVVATDTDTRFLEALGAEGVEVRRHDIVADAIEPGVYDLAHCRLLLEHLPESDAALDHMIEALKPGGVLVLEEFDHVSFLPDPESSPEAQTAWQAWTDAFTRLAEARGLDLAYGRRMAKLLRRRGLDDVTCEGRTIIERGGVAGRGLLRLSILSLRRALTETGAIDDAGIDALAAFLEDPDFVWQSQIMVTATARKPR
jgi:2-polyprenyl-3-methyl-5-hydroxy-6-metoxy-1,4-benzoquinol methylase